MNLPVEIDVATRACVSSSDARSLHRLKIRLAKLVLHQAPPSAVHHLALAEQFVSGAASTAALLEARQDLWAHVGSLACGCTLTDSASAQAIMTCLETEEAAHTVESLREQTFRILQCGVPKESVLHVLG